MDRAALIGELNKEFQKPEDLIPFVDESKYIDSTHSLNCDALDIPMKDLQNLSMYIEELRGNLERAGAKDYAKMQSSLYAKMAGRCVDYIIQEKIKNAK